MVSIITGAGTYGRGARDSPDRAGADGTADASHPRSELPPLALVGGGDVGGTACRATHGPGAMSKGGPSGGCPPRAGSGEATGAGTPWDPALTLLEGSSLRWVGTGFGPDRMVRDVTAHCLAPPPVFAGRGPSLGVAVVGDGRRNAPNVRGGDEPHAEATPSGVRVDRVPAYGLGGGSTSAEGLLPDALAVRPSDPAGSRFLSSSVLVAEAVAVAPQVPAPRTPPGGSDGWDGAPIGEPGPGARLRGGGVPILGNRVGADRRFNRKCAVCGGALCAGDVLRFVFEGEVHGECWELRIEATREQVDTVRGEVGSVAAVARYLVAQTQHRLPSLMMPPQPGRAPARGPVLEAVGVDLPPADRLTAGGRPGRSLGVGVPADFMVSIITVIRTISL